MSDLDKKITPATLEEILENSRPVEMHGAAPVEEGTIITTYDPEPIDTRSQQLTHQLDQVPLRWFTLAPVYAVLRVPFSIPAEFVKSELGAGATILTFELPFPVVRDIPGWENKIEGIDPDKWDNFTYFLGELGFQRRDTIWVLNAYDMVMQDQQHPSASFNITVFTPESSESGVAAYSAGGGPAEFYKTTGHARAVNMEEIYNVEKK